MKRAIVFLCSLSLLAVLSGCAKTVADKKVVSLHYTGTLADGTQFDTSVGKEPLEFMVGTKSMIPGFEKAVMGMKVGEKKKFEIKAVDAYGEHDPQRVEEVPMASFPEGMKLEKGLMLSSGSVPWPVTVAEVKEKTVLVDYNHPLAGKNLTFDIEIVKIRDATRDELTSAAAPQAKAQ
jgi:peptidylprolyl isomerase